MFTFLGIAFNVAQITPAHDPNDFEVGKRHNLEFINIFTDDGKINSNGGADFVGMPRFKAREAVIDALQKKVFDFIDTYMGRVIFQFEIVIIFFCNFLCCCSIESLIVKFLDYGCVHPLHPIYVCRKN